MLLLLISIIVALLISGFCSLMEAVLLSLTPGQVAELSSRSPRIGSIWQRFKTEVERPIAAILILNTAAHTIGASIAGAEFDAQFGNRWIWAFSLAFTFLMLQFTEIMPKGLGVRYNSQIALWIAQPLSILVRALMPLVGFVHWINRPFGYRAGQSETSSATLEEITALAGLARLSSQISPHQEQIIKQGARISQSQVIDVMRSTVEIDAFDLNTPADEIVGVVVMSGFARVPVYDGDLDHIVGFVYIKDVLLQLYMGWPIELPKLLRTAPFVADTLPLDDLLQVFHRERTQIAFVRNQDNQVVGLITMEDVLEEFVGEIYDEHRQQ